MKAKKKRRKFTMPRQCPNLISCVGKVTLDKRLRPLRMDRKYRETLEEAERERNAKV